MRIGIHKEFGTGCIGGAEYMMAVLAEALRDSHDVEIVHHQSGMTREQLTAMFGNQLQGVELRYVPPKEKPNEKSVNPWRKYANARSRYAELSRGYDLFVSLTHGEEPPPFCHATIGMLVVLFPLSERPSRWPYGTNGWGGRLKERIGRRYLEWEWQQRLRSYRIHAGISEYVRRWTAEFWGIDSQLLYPPVEAEFSPVEKRKNILSVGRYGKLKNQLALVDAFRSLSNAISKGWRLVCSGGVGAAADEKEYFQEVCRKASGFPIDVQCNARRQELKSDFEQAAIFWHAAGYGADKDLQPGQSEHFGIVTVEAMAAGCVPVVIRKGAQPELIEHGVNGFLWDTLDELRDYTCRLVKDESLRERMAQAARKRASRFNKNAFVARFHELLNPHLPLHHKSMAT